MIKFKTHKWDLGELIEEVEVEKETDKSVWINGRRCAKESSFENYHATWEQAHEHLTARAEAKLGRARLALQHAQGYAGNVKGLRR